MTAPTRDEIKAGYDAVTRDGPGARITAELSLLALRDPSLKDTLDRIAAGLKTLQELGSGDAALRGALNGALITGLHLGLHIGESRRPR